MSGSLDTSSDVIQHHSTNETSVRSSALLYDLSQPVMICNFALGPLTVFMCGCLFVRQLRARQFYSVSSFLTLSLILIDVFGGISNILSAIFINRIISDTSFNVAGCKSAWFLRLSTTGWAEWTVVFVTIERYDAVINSIRRKFSTTKAIVCMCLSSLIVAVFPLLIVTGWSGPQARIVLLLPEQNMGVCVLRNDWNSTEDVLTFEAACYGVTFCLPALLTVIFLILMLSLVWKVSKRTYIRRATSERNARNRGSARATSTTVRSRGFRFICAIIICKIICILPLEIYHLGLDAKAFDYNAAAYVFSNMLNSANVAVDSFLYVLWLKENDPTIAEMH
ncbi:phe13-bombesin receptor-like [Oscarella lobularis]|uniref:phe13-bombesin receptor-like n=1 Tax=Oscarella lobularis TaxID=121494 RepID=UPI00331376E4